jgi:hypothetical protein
MHMATSPTWLNAQAAYLFRQAAEAHRKGNAPLADALTKGACRCLDRLAEQESAAVSALTIPEPRLLTL